MSAERIAVSLEGLKEQHRLIRESREAAGLCDDEDDWKNLDRFFVELRTALKKHGEVNIKRIK